MVTKEMMKKIQSTFDKKNTSEFLQGLGEIYRDLEKDFSNFDKNAEDNAYMVKKTLLQFYKILPAQMSFVCGQFYAKIENLEDGYRENLFNLVAQGALSSKSAQKIVEYLYEVGIVVRTEAIRALDMEEAEFDTNMKVLTESGLTEMRHGPEYAHCELTARGYVFYNTHYAKDRGWMF